ncbi:MAG TPA: hypothetical protein PLN69_04060 [bacterium]|nr:hypothetical protein [bacterium]
MDNGFFISLVGKVVVDEKKIYSVLSELRALRFDLEHDLEGELEGEGARMGMAEELDSGDYAVEVLDNLEQTLQKMMIAVRDKKRMFTQCPEQEVKGNGAAEI